MSAWLHDRYPNNFIIFALTELLLQKLKETWWFKGQILKVMNKR